jgi:hypothetical protein
MSKNIKLLGMVSVMALVAACGNNNVEEEFIAIDPAPISQEPVHTGKYK